MGAHAPITFTIAKKSVTASLATGSVTKVYDGTTAAGTGTINLTTGDILSGDSGVTVTAGTIPAYSASTVGSSYSLDVPVVLNGNSNNNYTLANNTVAVTGEITAKPITLADGTLKITKEYDGTNSAGTATGVLSSNDFVSGDNISVSISDIGTYSDADVGKDKTVSLNVGLDGTATGNYSLANNTYSFTKAEITKATPTVNVTVVKKTTRSFFGLSIGSKEDTFTITATVTGVNGEKPTGTVNFKNGSTAITSNVSVTDGTATYEWVKPLHQPIPLQRNLLLPAAIIKTPMAHQLNLILVKQNRQHLALAVCLPP